jgi:hypothetical protein
MAATTIDRGDKVHCAASRHRAEAADGAQRRARRCCREATRRLGRALTRRSGKGSPAVIAAYRRQSARITPLPHQCREAPNARKHGVSRPCRDATRVPDKEEVPGSSPGSPIQPWEEPEIALSRARLTVRQFGLGWRRARRPRAPLTLALAVIASVHRRTVGCRALLAAPPR